MFKRGKKKTITDDEYKFICESKAYSHMKTKLRLISEKVDKPEPKKKDESKTKESSEKEGDKKAQSGEDSTSSTVKKTGTRKKAKR